MEHRRSARDKPGRLPRGHGSRPSTRMSRPRSFLPEICALSCAALLIEVSYTRVVSFKFFYFYAYLVLGLAMLGIGSGAVWTALASAWPGRSLESMVARDRKSTRLNSSHLG